MPSKRKRNFTIRSAGVLFLLSAAAEVLSLDARVPLFGALLGGAVAFAYHLGFAAIFAAIGVGLWRPTRWGIQAYVFGGALYTLDRIGYLWSRQGFEVYLVSEFGRYQELAQMVPMDQVFRLVVLMNALFVAGWWAFALYLRRK